MFPLYQLPDASNPPKFTPCRSFPRSEVDFNAASSGYPTASHLRDGLLRLPQDRILQVVVGELAAEIGFVGAHVEVAVAAEVEEDGPGLAGLLAPQGLVDGRPDGVAALRRRQDP